MLAITHFLLSSPACPQFPTHYTLAQAPSPRRDRPRDAQEGRAPAAPRTGAARRWGGRRVPRAAW